MSLIYKITAVLLFPLVVLWTIIIWLRNKLYDLGLLRTHTLEAKVISVGNIHMGGTGKTPFVEYLSRLLALMLKKQPAVLTRGYKRNSDTPVIVDNGNRARLTAEMIGDEPYLLSQNLKDVRLGVDSNRYRMAEMLLEKYPESVLILDDGFQHRRMPRTLDIVLIDVSRWTALPFLFPLSFLRDVKSSLRRAGVIVLTRINTHPRLTEKLKQRLSKRYNVPVLTADTRAQGLWSVDAESDHLSVKALNGKHVAVFCGLGNPRQFFNMLTEAGAKIVYKRIFPDHHSYSRSDVRVFFQQASKAGAIMHVTTQKDAVKIGRFIKTGIEKIYYLDIDMFVKEEVEFIRILKESLEG